MNTEIDADPPAPTGDTTASRLWRSIWRTHFYAGWIAAPILVLLAVTGLVILYTEPINARVHDEVVNVDPGDRDGGDGGGAASFEDQRTAVTDVYPELSLVAVTPPETDEMSTKFSGSDEDGTLVDVYVDPYTAQVLGQRTIDDDVVGLANRLHGNLNNEGVTVPVPTIAGVFGEGPALADLAVGDLVVEVFAGWGLVLALTGAYLWWPRKKGTGRPLFVPRLSRLRKPGRAKWRDLHAISGTALAGLLVFFIVTGLPWSAAWGANWSYVASEATPNQATSFWEWEGPASAQPVTGDLDRAGHRIPWAASGDAIPSSGGGGHEGHGGGGASSDDGSAVDAADGPVAEPVSLDLVVDAAEEEGMSAGYTINLPVDLLDDPEDPVYGSYVVTNPWPSRMHDQGAIYLDQFSGKTLAESTPSTWGRLQWATEWGIETHMGTQYGLVTRILMTGACLLVLWNVATALVMWNKRRRKGTLGLPRRPIDVRMQRTLGITAIALAVIYPVWGLSLLLILLFDRFVVRRVPKLRVAFGMR